jgi:glycosyltransferase involved in cell wall biosynthesis
MKSTNNRMPDAFNRLALVAQQAPTIPNFRGPFIRELVSRGVTVYAFAPDYDETTRAAVAALGAVPMDYSMSATGMNPVMDILDLFRLSAQLRRLKLYATFAYTTKPVIYATLAARFAGVANRFAMVEGAGYVFTDDENLSFRRHFLRAVVTLLLRIGLSQVRRVFLLNPDDRDLFVDKRMVIPEKIELLNGIGLDLNHFYLAPPVPAPVTFISVARLLREKGVYEYIEAARRVKAGYPGVRFVLLGNVHPNPGSFTEAEVKALVSEGVVEWPGQVSDVRPWIAQSSVFVLPSYREGLPRSTQEAMAMGRPVITTDVPGCRETVEDGVNGFLVPVRNPDALAAAMIRFIEQPSLIASMGAASRRMAERNFDVHKINAQILALMDIESGSHHDARRSEDLRVEQ